MDFTDERILPVWRWSVNNNKGKQLVASYVKQPIEDLDQWITCLLYSNYAPARYSENFRPTDMESVNGIVYLNLQIRGGHAEEMIYASAKLRGYGEGSFFFKYIS